MTTWIIAFNKDGNTSTLKHDSNNRPNLDDAVELVTQKAERDYELVESGLISDSDEATPAVRLVERYGITITGIAQR